MVLVAQVEQDQVAVVRPIPEVLGVQVGLQLMQEPAEGLLLRQVTVVMET
jgi:hypothetical protein